MVSPSINHAEEYLTRTMLLNRRLDLLKVASVAPRTFKSTLQCVTRYDQMAPMSTLLRCSPAIPNTAQTLLLSNTLSKMSAITLSCNTHLAAATSKDPPIPNPNPIDSNESKTTNNKPMPTLTGVRTVWSGLPVGPSIANGEGRGVDGDGTKAMMVMRMLRSTTC